MNMIRTRLTPGAGRLALLVACLPVLAGAQLPEEFDLRRVAGEDYVSSVKEQSGGTCWAHAVMASMESNLMMTGTWTANGEIDEPDLSEYHLDWWNGFNEHFNADIHPSEGGLTVHEGGDYLVATAYTSRGDGAVRNLDAQQYHTAPDQADTSYHVYYPRHVEWYTAGSDLSRIGGIKRALMDYGAVGTCVHMDENLFMEYGVHYQPPSHTYPPNHAVTIIGWDDTKPSHAPRVGAWLVKNSWGEEWGNGGYFWVSYYDKHACQDPEMGAVSFREVELMRYDHVYQHDYHGWRDEAPGVTEAMNVFAADRDEMIVAASFFTAADSVDYSLVVYDDFDGSSLSGVLTSASGHFEKRGFHTIDFDTPSALADGEDFYAYLELSHGGHPFDRTSDVSVLLGARYRVIVESRAEPGQSYYLEDGSWIDLTTIDDTANFCIKVLTEDLGFSVDPDEQQRSVGPVGGPFSPDSLTYEFEYHGADPVGFEVVLDPPVDWLTLDGNTTGVLESDESTSITLVVNEAAGELVQGLHVVDVVFELDSEYLVDVSREMMLVVGDPVTRYGWTLDSDPGWGRDGLWDFGQPEGGGGQNGNPDPTAGHTGDNVLGYDLSGDYAANMSEEHLTTGPIDCTGFSETHLNFWRWLGVEKATYDHAYVRASTDSIEWTTLWENEFEIADYAWTFVSLDISGFADGVDTLYLRWTMGETDIVDNYCGWNLDDISITAYDLIPPPEAEEPVSSLRLRAPRPNPFNEDATISFVAPEPGAAEVSIYDLSGRLLRRMRAADCGSGTGCAVWDGRDRSGNAVASGVYFVRVTAGDLSASGKIVLVR
jgi:C1A family cysteine protease